MNGIKPNNFLRLFWKAFGLLQPRFSRLVATVLLTLIASLSLTHRARADWMPEELPSPPIANPDEAPVPTELEVEDSTDTLDVTDNLTDNLTDDLTELPSTPVRTVYRADLFCQALEPLEVELELASVGDDRGLSAVDPQAASDWGITAEITAAIGVVLKQWTGSDVGIAGYRVAIGDRVATVDLRRDPNAARPWTALSTCEQFALFGGLRETIVNESDWGVERVEFLSLGEPLAF